MKLLILLLLTTNIFAKNFENTEYILPTINYSQSASNEFIGAGLYGNVITNMCVFVDYKWDFDQSHIVSVGITKVISKSVFVFMGASQDITDKFRYDGTAGFVYKKGNFYTQVSGSTLTGLSVGVGVVGIEIFSEIKEQKVEREIDYSRYVKMN